MKVDSFLSLKDYFNYYLSGFIWLMNILIIVGLISYCGCFRLVFDDLGKVFESLGIIATGIIALLVPYITGFVLYPIGQFVRKKLQGKDRKWWPSPRKWLLIRSEDLDEYKNQPKHKPFLKGSRFSKKEAQLLLDLAENRFNLSYKKTPNLLFFPVRTYLLEYGNESAKFAMRMRDLMSLTESLIVVVPLFVILIAFPLFEGWWKFVGVIIAIYIQYLLISRYHRLEIDWVKRVYRGFLVLESKDKKQ